MRLDVVAAPGPRERLCDRPTARAFAVEPELVAQPVEPVAHLAPAVPELGRADDRRRRELAFSRERLRVDHEPGLALCCEDVFAVEVLVEQHRFPLRRRQLLEAVEGGVEQPALVPSAGQRPLALEVFGPPRRLVGERPEALWVDPETREERDQDTEGLVAGTLGEVRAGLAALEQERRP